MTFDFALGNPTTPGLYCARQWYGYRILEWDGEKWWHPGRSAPWPVAATGETGIEAHAGPLPTISKDFTKPFPHRGRDNRVPQTIEPEPEDWETQFPGAPSPAGQAFDL